MSKARQIQLTKAEQIGFAERRAAKIMQSLIQLNRECEACGIGGVAVTPIEGLITSLQKAAEKESTNRRAVA